MEAKRHSRLLETANRLFPTPFEERRSWVGMMPYKAFRKWRVLPFFVVPFIVVGYISECRGTASETLMTPLHIWLADKGVWRHDTIKALDPAYDDERINSDWSRNDQTWRSTRTDLPSIREVKQFAAVNQDRQRLRDNFSDKL